MIPPEEQAVITYADPTGEQVVRLRMGRDLTVSNGPHNPVFTINSTLLLDLIEKHVEFTPTRRGNMLRAHKKNAPAAGGHQREGEVTELETQK